MFEEAVPRPVRELCARLEQGGFAAWLVGGSLRDVLLGRPVQDWDVATAAHPEQVMRLFERTVPTGVQHGTVTVLLGGQGHEVTTLRGERGHSDGRRPDAIVFLDDIEADLARRDFTVNALAYSLSQRQLIDPFGGVADLQARLLRAVGDAAQRFSEDGLRILRAARLAAVLDFALEASTRQAMPGAIGTFRKVSRERVRDELGKLLASAKPSRGLELMQEAGMLAAIGPELAAGTQAWPRGSEERSAWQHALAAVDAAPDDLALRLAALLQAIAAPAEPAAWRSVADKANAWLRAWRFANDERETAVACIEHHAFAYRVDASDAALRRWLRQIGKQRWQQALHLAQLRSLAWQSPLAAEAAAVERCTQRCQRLLADSPALELRDLALQGSDLLAAFGRPAGPWVGQLLREMLELVLDEPALNEREKLLEWAKIRLIEG